VVEQHHPGVAARSQLSGEHIQRLSRNLCRHRRNARRVQPHLLRRGLPGHRDDGCGESFTRQSLLLPCLEPEPLRRVEPRDPIEQQSPAAGDALHHGDPGHGLRWGPGRGRQLRRHRKPVPGRRGPRRSRKRVRYRCRQRRHRLDQRLCPLRRERVLSGRRGVVGRGDAPDRNEDRLGHTESRIRHSLRHRHGEDLRHPRCGPLRARDLPDQQHHGAALHGRAAEADRRRRVLLHRPGAERLRNGNLRIAACRCSGYGRRHPRSPAMRVRLQSPEASSASAAAR
jgi:hypothetical protein